MRKGKEREWWWWEGIGKDRGRVVVCGDQTIQNAREKGETKAAI